MKKITAVSALILFIFMGCQQKQKNSPQKITAKPDIQLSVVAQYIRSDASRYITQQKYEIFSQPKAIFVSAAEPYGTVQWSVQNGIYTPPNNKKIYDKETSAIMLDKDIAQGILELYLAGLKKVQIQETAETFNFNGQIYECVAKNEQNVKLFRNKKTGELDLVTAGNAANGQFYIIFGYNSEKTGKSTAQDEFYAKKVDIYLQTSTLDKKLIAQLNCSLH
jgi:hypothetical protein